ncbi:protein phosphatase [Mycena floridula]|nr:protein phosphatase [Mycena floridula]
MDSIRVSKVEHVSYTKSGTNLTGTVHLTAHHLIFQFGQSDEKEVWVPYPLISLVTRLPQTLQGHCPLTFHCRTFETFSLSFSSEPQAVDVFESVKELTVASSVDKLYAFFYTPKPAFPSNNGWSVYSPREEFGRMGVGIRSKAWRFTDVNKDYSFCPTYPARLVVPTKISDTTLQYAAKYRSKCRIPVLSYLHWSNFGSITRSSQPMVGITQNRSVQDEKLIEAVFQTHHNPDSRASGTTVYGATTTNLIVDARPTANAVANTAKGAGTENMDNYKEGRKVYLGIDHIHAMRESLAKVVEALRDADSMLASINNDLNDQLSNISVLDRQALRRSGWLRHISAILEGTVLITRNIHINSSHVLIHCSDGWDRTSQLSATAQLCLDPFYRTISGFQILIEKDWLSYGHKFLDRCGHLSSDKFFISPTESSSSGSGADTAQAFLASMQNRFASQHHIKETSPVFHQFLETVRQIQRQFPDRFEFNERFLHQLYYHLYSCQFGTFLYNCERDRRVGENGPPPVERTISIWDFFNSPSEMQQNLNPEYNTSLDDPKGRDMGVLYPNPKDVRFWHELIRPVPVVRETERDVETLEEDPGLQRTGTPSSVPLPPSPSRTPSELTASRTASLGSPSSLAEQIPRPPSVAREDSFRPIDSRSSAFSMRPTTDSPPLPQSPLTPGRSARIGPDLFGNSSMKSVWGKLSSNASAALSVMQEAYEGVARNVSADTGKTEELSSRDSLKAWGDDQPSTSSLPPLAELDNPWGSVRTSTSSAALPSARQTFTDIGTTSCGSYLEPDPVKPPADNTDPLGVGLL